MTQTRKHIKKQLATSLLLLLILPGFRLSAQADLSWTEKPELSFLAFTDIFYAYDFNRPKGTYRQPFLFNHNRHNEFNLNLGLVKLGLANTKYRANLALQSGTYVNDNYAAEPAALKNIFEANVGLSLNKGNTLWLDAGILPSHIGFESAISMDNPTLTRSLLAENSPYFLTGAKLTLTPHEKWEIAGLVVNGWQRIQRLEGNSLPSFGTQVNFSPSENTTLNWSTFIGTDDPDTTRRMRYFNNFFGQFQLSERLSLIAAFDVGIQQRSIGSTTFDIWFSPILIGQLSLSPRWNAAIRAEYYQDETGIMIPTGTPNGFATTGLSLNLDYLPAPHVACRIEGRWLSSTDNIFETPTTPTNQNFTIGTSIAIRFVDSWKK